jgi:hypothetical protein
MLMALKLEHPILLCEAMLSQRTTPLKVWGWGLFVAVVLQLRVLLAMFGLKSLTEARLSPLSC